MDLGKVLSIFSDSSSSLLLLRIRTIKTISITKATVVTAMPTIGTNVKWYGW